MNHPAFVIENNKATLQRGYDEVFNGRNLDLLDEMIAPDAVDDGAPELSGVDAFKTPIAALLAAFPDLQLTTEMIVADDNTVMALATFTGTHEGEFMGIPGSGKQITWSHVDINRIEDGKVVEAWHIGTEAMLQALGFQLAPPDSESAQTSLEEDLFTIAKVEAQHHGISDVYSRNFAQ
ncbi:ester cyclase [Chloroflexi bacterium TSY]|nr:ester cyclase [Chloroflexi bacterium TSY]